MKIYHYTSSIGLISILKGKILWATHFNYLNDKSEYQHAKEVILKVIEELKDINVLKHKEVIKVVLQQIYSNYDIYTCSFSKKTKSIESMEIILPK